MEGGPDGVADEWMSGEGWGRLGDEDRWSAEERMECIG